MTKSILVSCLGILFFFNSYSQNSERILRAYSFFKETQPGNIPVDENGRPMPVLPNFERTLYIECSGTKMPVIKEILFNNIPLTFTVNGTNEINLMVGKKYENEQKIILTAKKGNKIWKIISYPSNEEPIQQQNLKQILIKTQSGKKNYKFYIYKETRLYTPDAY